MAKYEFCSDAYLREARELLARLAADYASALGDERFSSCVVCSNPPAHLRQDGRDIVFWTMRVGANVAEVVRELDTEVDSVVTAEYAGSLARARRILGETEGELEDEPGVQRTGDLSKVSPAMRALLRAFHNAVAEITA